MECSHFCFSIIPHSGTLGWVINWSSPFQFLSISLSLSVSLSIYKMQNIKFKMKKRSLLVREEQFLKILVREKYTYLFSFFVWLIKFLIMFGEKWGRGKNRKLNPRRFAWANLWVKIINNLVIKIKWT